MSPDPTTPIWTPDPEKEREELLFVGDMHLGRRPSGMDELLADQGLRPGQLSPAAALKLLVDHALEHPPRAVVFAGDLVDEDDDRFEAYAVLEREVGRLQGAGIPVLAVAGNHDGLVLPRLIERVPGVEQLGAGGTWERRELEGPGPPVDLVAWSFPGRHHSGAPLEQPDLQEVLGRTRREARVIGVLHGDLDSAASRYAPLSRQRLVALPAEAWFLGHVHQPGELAGDGRPIGYLGSLVGLDPGEPGARGPWRVRLGERGEVRALQVALSPIRWERFQLRLDEAEAADEDGIHERLEEWLRQELAADPGLDHGHLRVVVARVEFTGALAGRAAVRNFVRDHRPGKTVFRFGEVPVLVQRVYDRTRAAVDLDALSEETSPVGHVARRLLELRSGEAKELDTRATRQLEDLGDWGLVDEERLELPSARELLERSAWRVLDTLLAQREEKAGA